MAYMLERTRPTLGDYGTFDAYNSPDGLGLRIFKKKKKKAAPKSGVAPVVGAPKKRKKKKSLLRRVGKGLLKVAPVAAGIFLPGAGAVAVGAVSGAIGRGKPKLKNIIRGAAIAGGTKIVANAVRSGQAGRILVKGKKALGSALRGGGKVVGKVASGTGDAISNIAKGKIGAKEAAVLGIGGAAVAIAAKKLIGGGGGEVTDEPVVPGDPGTVEPTTPIPVDEGPGPYPAPEGPTPTPYTPGPTDEGPGDPNELKRRQCEAMGGTYDPVRQVCKLPQTGGGYPGDATGGGGGGDGPSGPVPGPTPSPTDTPTAGQLPTAGGTVPDTATGALFPGSGGDAYTPAFPDADGDGIPDEEEAKDDGKKKALLIAAGIAAVIILTRKKRKGA